MHRILIITLMLKTLLITGQSFTSDNRNSLKASYGYFVPWARYYKNPIETRFGTTFSSPRPFVALSLEHPRGYGSRNICGEYGVSYFLNQTKNPGDTLTLHWFANNFFLVLKYDMFPQNKYIDLFICGGGLVGSQRIIVDDKERRVYRNFNAALIPRVELRVQTVKRISLGLEAAFLYDLSNTRWKSRPDTWSPDHSAFTGTTLNAFVGWCWGK
ncbi:MAG: hypothetical protein JST26_13410 [Bacteroidetes bacterium]|nr:hypothetical protein [Bacteroidota bacterium]